MATKGKKKPVKKRSAPKTANQDAALRKQLAETLTWEGAHVGWKSALAALPPKSEARKLRGFRIPPGNCWSMLESRSGTFSISASIRNTKHWNGRRDTGRRIRHHPTTPRGKSRFGFSWQIRRRW